VAEEVKCNVCGARNAPGVQFCESCGVELAATTAPAEPEIDRLLEELVEIRPESGAGDKETLDIDKEIVDELLDSLLVEEEAAEQFSCPLCGTKLPVDSKACSKCGATFVAVEPGAVAPPPPEEESARAGPRLAPTKGPVSVAVTEEEAKGLRALSGKLIDIVVLGTILGLVGVFAGFQMWSWNAVTTNPGSVGVFLGVAAGGFLAGFVLFRLSTSAIAQGDRLVKEGRNDDALFYYDRAIRMGSKPASAWTSKGVALKRLGRLDDALRAHNLALKIDADNEIAWCNKGDIYFRVGTMDSAIDCYDKAIALRPKYAIAWNNKGAALARMERFAEARKCHDEAVKIRPKYAAAWLNRGEVLARLGLREEAEFCLEKAKALTA
jgi:regulator of sirC expression with transglutaminase-like and TPR domain/ribosomal protein L40E